MTFTEAAEAVLRKSGKPLHYKKITQLAIEQNLLSHVGKTPEVTMSTRLATLAKKDRGDAAIVRVKPGVFGLRDWGAEAVEAAEEATAEGEEELEAATPAATAAEAGEAPAAEEVARSPEEKERAERIAAAASLFPEEADDNEPVLGEKPAPAGEAAGEARGRRRRRRRRGRGTEREAGVGNGEGLAAGEADLEGAESDVDLTAAGELEGEAEVAGAEAPLAEEGAPALETEAGEAAVPPATAEAPRAEARREPRERREERHADRREERREERHADRREERREERRAEERRDERHADRREERRAEEVREETGRDAADLLVSLLNRHDERQPVPVRALVDEALRSGKVAGDAGLLAASFTAAARADGARREGRGERPRLRVANGRIALVDWALGPELVRAEADALIALERLRDAARRQLLRRINELPQPAFTELLVLLLERLGINSIRAARRPGLPQGEIHLTGVARRATEEVRVAVVLKRGGEIGRERIIELRGSLHHYGSATSGWVVTTGNVLSGAREEAAQANTAPVALIDGTALARLLDEHRVGVRHATVSIPFPDLDLFDALRS
jgi:hypothetical protein